ncbi:MAG: kasugamycin N-acetyltransferase AAC(2')-IIb [Paenibacillus dendritiformis]|uniref:kasugamycin N-acetyltransferase AAC(2')-IIb n=1 Tax=uncultured Paenibacillus sp. TaxID=227322 RepID=UPI0025FB3F1B|nr:kasugamycin N-acetyltransferase AAC(2')-IIb [uncultured Paenibacillus sp.]MDU5143920.1 kasugamycin N-acetyltransferase AAC(2')-IIb [Paenibacillus dendritiformis]
MSDQEKNKPAAHVLMELHAEAMFTHDRSMRLLAINEPWPGGPPAPRFFLGRSTDGSALCRVRHDVPEKLAGKLTELCADEPIIRDFRTKPKHFEAYMSLLHSECFTMGPCYLVPDTVPAMEVVALTRDNCAEMLYGGFEWLASELDYAQPCVALVLGNRAVSICRSVRIAAGSHEAGLETLETCRGRGYAGAVVAGWARAVRKMNACPLYSTLEDNLSSQRVARKLAMSWYGVNFTII